MKIALLTADIGNSMPNVGDYFITEGIRRKLEGHDCRRFPLHRRPTSETIETLRTFDKLIICGTNLIGSQGTVRCGLEVSDFEAIGRPVLPIGLGSQADLDSEISIDERGRRLLEYWYQSTGPLSVRDEMTYEFVMRELGKGSAVLTGCPSLFYREKRNYIDSTFSLFSPGPFHYEMPRVSRQKFLSRQEKWFREWAKKERVVYLAQQPSDLNYRAPVPGLETFYAPRNPEKHGEAIVNARRVISARIHPCLVAVSNGVPAVLIALDRRTKSLAETMGIPYSEFGQASVNGLRALFKNYPWETIQARVRKYRSRLESHFEEHGLNISTEASEREERVLRFAAISDESRLPLLMGLIQNLKRVHSGPISATLLALDKRSVWEISTRNFGIKAEVLSLEDIWDPIELKKVSKLPTARRAYISKPRLMEKRIAREKNDCYFFDVDLLFFESPLAIGLTGGSSTLLFPHRSKEIRYGIYNSGMFLCRPGSEPFLEWWTERCLEACDNRTADGLYFEQKYLDEAPSKFPSIEIAKDERHNVGPWSFDNTRPDFGETEPGVPRLLGKHLASYHAAQPDPFNLIGLKAAEDQSTLLWGIGKKSAPTSELLNEIYYQQANHWSELKRVVFLYHLLRYRLGFKIVLWPAIVKFLVCGPGRLPVFFISQWYSRLRDMKRRLLSHPTGPEVVPRFLANT